MSPRLDTTAMTGPWTGSLTVGGAPGARQEDDPAADLVGRAVELASLQHFVDELDEPCLLLAGPGGSGRTRLLRVLHRSRRDRTVLVREQTALSQRPWSGLAALLHALELPAGEVLAHVDAEISEIVRRTVDSLARHVRPRGGPIVALVDDLDLQDERSQAVIAELAVRPADQPVRLIASVAWPTGSPRSDEMPVLRLDPLSDDDMRRIVPVLTGGRVDAATGDLLARLSGGLPGVLAAHLERLTSAQRSGRAPLALPLPPVLPGRADAVAARFGLQAEDLDVLRRVSTAPAVSIDALPALVGAGIDRLEPLIARGLLSRAGGYVSLPDAELRAELYWRLSSAARRDVHSAAAKAEEHVDPDLRDWHRSHLGTDSSTPSALYAASSSLLRKGLTLEAVELAERALALTSTGRPVQQQLEFARELLLHGALDLARRHLPRDRATMSRRQVLQRGALELVVRVLGDRDLSMEHVDALVGRYRVELPEAVADLLALAGVLLVFEGSVDDGLWRIEAATRIHSPEPDGRSLHHWAERLRSAVAGGTDRRDSAPPPVPAEVEVEVRVTAATALMWEERYAEAREQFAIVMSGWRGAGSPWSVRALSLAVDNEIRAGDLTHAAELAERMRRADAVPDEFGAMSLAWLALAQGRTGEAERLLRQIDLELDLRKRFAVHALGRIRGTEALLGNDPEDAVRRLRTVLHSTPELDPSVLRVHPELLEAHWRSGDHASAQAVVDRFAEAVAAAPSRWGELALLRCRALLSDDVDSAFVTALVAFRSGELPFDRARTHAWYALALEGAGMPDRAAEQRRTAIEAFGGMGATAWMRLTGSVDPVTHEARRDLPMLTDTELAVLRLARQGAHNREIAASLFMSLRTVELRLTQLYRKFGARSRSHLFTLLPDDWPDEPGRSSRS